MARAIAYVYGTAIAPGVSKNGRLYTRDMIRDAVAEGQRYIAADGADMPLDQRSHHEANDDSLRLTGRLLSLTYDESTGAAKFKAAIPPTQAGRDIHALIDTEGDTPPYLKGVSIRGAWKGPERTVVHEGRQVKTGDGLRLLGLDYTASPGVSGAVIDRVETAPDAPTETVPATGTPGLIFESADDVDAFTEEGPPVQEKGAPALKSGKPAAPPTPGASNYADPGYQDDKAKRYPLDTLAHAKSAWSYINQPRNAKMYTAPQLKRIKDRIRKALAKFGVKITAESWLMHGDHITETGVAEHDVWPDRPGSYCVSVDNGMVAISVSSFQVDPADLEMCARAAMEGACAALAQLDPDMDGDIDTADGETDDNDMESAPEESVTSTPAVETAPPDPATTEAAVTTETETGMAESTLPEAAGQAPAPAATPPATPAAAPQENAAPAEQAPSPFEALSAKLDTLAAALGAVVDKLTPAPVAVAAESAPAAPVVEQAPNPVVTESEDDRIARLVQEGIKAALPAAVQAHVEENGVQRKGLVTEHSAAVAKPAGPEVPDYWPRDENGAPKKTLTDQELYDLSVNELPAAVYGALRRPA